MSSEGSMGKENFTPGRSQQTGDWLCVTTCADLLMAACPGASSLEHNRVIIIIIHAVVWE